MLIAFRSFVMDIFLRQSLSCVFIGCATLSCCCKAMANDSLNTSFNTSLDETDKPNIAQTTDNATDIKQLANHITWRRLLHYDDDGKQSRVLPNSEQTSAFFVSKMGHKNPHMEMVSMLTALLSTDDAMLGEQSVQCRFPARTKWLSEMLQLQAGMDYPQTDCSKYRAWMQTYHPAELSLIFAQEYPDNMAAAFAHTLLRIDTQPNAKQNHYQHAYALNYTVNGNGDDNMVNYAYQSFTGGYPSVVTIDPYQQKISSYLKKHQRDIWSYRLRLNDDEKQQFIRHIWETKDLSLPYYFMMDNCASEILRIIDVVKPEQQLFRQVRHMAIPRDIVQLLEQVNLLDKGEYLPSDASLKQGKLNQSNLQFDTKNMENPIVLNENFTANLWANNDPTQGHGTHQVGVYLGQVGSRAYAELTARIAMQDLLDGDDGYRQFLDLQTGLVKIRFYDKHENVKAKPTPDIELNELTLIKTRSYHPVNTARAGKGKMADWGAMIQAKQVNDASLDRQHVSGQQADSLTDRHLVANLAIEKGMSLVLGQPKHMSDKTDTIYNANKKDFQNNAQLPPHLCYGLMTAAGQFGKGLVNGYRVGMGLTLGCRLSINQRLRATAELQSPYWYQGGSKTMAEQPIQGHYWQPVAELGLQYDIAQGTKQHKNHHHAIRLIANHELKQQVANPTDIQLGWRWYF